MSSRLLKLQILLTALVNASASTQSTATPTPEPTPNDQSQKVPAPYWAVPLFIMLCVFSTLMAFDAFRKRQIPSQASEALLQVQEEPDRQRQIPSQASEALLQVQVAQQAPEDQEEPEAQVAPPEAKIVEVQVALPANRVS